MSKIADLDISDTIMVDWLYLPEDTRIFGAEYDPIKRCVVLRIAQSDLPELLEGKVVPRCDAQFRSDDDGNVKFDKWNIK